MIQTLKNMVERTLVEEPPTRNSDIHLTIRIWQRYYGVGDSLQVEMLNRLPREDNVKRIRAKFQNEELKYLPTDPEVAKKRGIAEEKWREELGYPTHQEIADRVLDEQLLDSPKAQTNLFDDPATPGKREIRDFG